MAPWAARRSRRLRHQAHLDGGPCRERSMRYPATTPRPRRKQLLVVEDDPAPAAQIERALARRHRRATVVNRGRCYRRRSRKHPYDCRGARPPSAGHDGVRDCSRQLGPVKTAQGNELPVVVFTGKDLSPEEDARSNMLARSVIVKDVESPEPVPDQTALFLHRVVGDSAR